MKAHLSHKIEIKPNNVQRTYNCSCGLTIDRDLNASINLANYVTVGSTV